MVLDVDVDAASVAVGSTLVDDDDDDDVVATSEVVGVDAPGAVVADEDSPLLLHPARASAAISNVVAGLVNLI
jgi:hypothetical protein